GPAKHFRGGKRSLDELQPRILEAVRMAVRSCKEDVGAHPAGCFELFGFDFLLDSEMRPWLLEDAGPSLREMTETALAEMLQLKIGLQDCRVQLPQGLQRPERDEAVV
ncbi:unnamed protein product, partial [Polarella glacialis]